MSGPKGIDDLFTLGLTPRIRQYRAVPPELGMRRQPHPAGSAGRVDRGTDLDTARGKTGAAITAMIRDRRKHIGEALLVRSAPGAGKSTAVAQALERYPLNARVFVGTTALAREQQAKYGYHLIEGRNQDNCQRYEVVKALQERGFPVEKYACVADGEPLCPFFLLCLYYRQLEQPGTWVAPAEQLYNPRFLRDGEMVILDDADLSRAMFEEHHVSLDDLLRGAEQLQGRRREPALRVIRVLQHALIDAPSGPLLGAELWDHLAHTAHRLGLDLVELIAALPNAGTMPAPGESSGGYLTVESIEAVPPASITVILRVLKEELPAFLEGEGFNSCLRLNRFGITVKRLREHATSREGQPYVATMPVLVLDATPIDSLVNRLLEFHERLPDVEAPIELPANVTVTQYAVATGHQSLRVGRNLRRTVNLVLKDLREHPVPRPEDAAVICDKSHRQAFIDAGFLPERVLSYGSVRGTNQLDEVRQLYVIGRPFPPSDDLVHTAQVIHRGSSPVSGQLAVVERAYGGKAIAIHVADYQDERVAELLRARREDEMKQVIHRARLLTLEPQRRLESTDQREEVRLVLVTSHPVPGLRVDELVVDTDEAPDLNKRRRRGAEERILSAIESIGREGMTLTVRAVSEKAGADRRTVRRVLNEHLGKVVDTDIGGRNEGAPRDPGTANHIENLGTVVDTYTEVLNMGVRHVPQTELDLSFFPRLDQLQAAPAEGGTSGRAVTCPGCGQRPAIEGRLCFRCDEEKLL